MYFKINVQPVTPAVMDTTGGAQLKRYHGKPQKPQDKESGFYFCKTCRRAYSLNRYKNVNYVEYYESHIKGNADRKCPACAGEPWKPYKLY